MKMIWWDKSLKVNSFFKINLPSKEKAKWLSGWNSTFSPWRPYSSSLNWEAWSDKFTGQRSVSSGQKSALQGFGASAVTLTPGTIDPGRCSVFPLYLVPSKKIWGDANITVKKLFSEQPPQTVPVEWGHWRLLLPSSHPFVAPQITWPSPPLSQMASFPAN